MVGMIGSEEWIPLGAVFGTVTLALFALWLFASSAFRRQEPASGTEDSVETLAVMRTRAAAGGGGCVSPRGR